METCGLFVIFFVLVVVAGRGDQFYVLRIELGGFLNDVAVNG